MAPSPERREEPPLANVVVVIPCYDEGLGVIDTIESIATQRKRPGEYFVQGTVVVINNRPDASAEVLSSNMTTYAALQSIRFGYEFKTGNKARDAKIRRIQESGMRIDVIDAFSGPHAHPENNVGYARKVGADHALSMLDRRPPKQSWREGEQPVLMSTDADSVLSPETLHTVWSAFWTEYADAVSVGSTIGTEGLDSHSDVASRAYQTYWGARSASYEMHHRIYALENKMMYLRQYHREPPIESALVTLGGASTAYSALAYEKSGGYPAIGAAEDTELGYRIVESGGIVEDISSERPNAVVITQPRISTRTDNGFGHSIGEWDARKGPFRLVMVDHPKVASETEEFLWALSPKSTDPTRIAKAEFRKQRLTKAEFENVCAEHEIPPDRTASLWGLYESWGGVLNSREHHELVRSARGIFEKRHGSVTMEEYVAQLENTNEHYWGLASKMLSVSGNNAFTHLWSWESFSESMAALIRPEGAEALLPEERADVEVKVRSIVASLYGISVTEVIQHFQILLMRALMEAADKDLIDEVDTMRDEITRVLKTRPVIDQDLYVGFSLARQAATQIGVMERAKITLTPHLSPSEIIKLESSLSQANKNAAALWHDYQMLEESKKKEHEKKAAGGE